MPDKKGYVFKEFGLQVHFDIMQQKAENSISPPDNVIEDLWSVLRKEIN